MVQWLGLSAFTAERQGSILGQGTKIPQAQRCSQKIKKKKNGCIETVLEMDGGDGCTAT